MSPQRTHSIIWAGIVAAVTLAVPTWWYGHQFLSQFFVSPFQFFIVPLWLIAYFSDRTGVMPLRSGPPLRRDNNPDLFRRNVRYCVVMGAMMYAFNLWISWQVLSRHR
jgi:hypothetical protein